MILVLAASHALHCQHLADLGPFLACVVMPPPLHGAEHVLLDWRLVTTGKGGVVQNSQNLADILFFVSKRVVPAFDNLLRHPVGGDGRHEAGWLVEDVAEVVFGDVRVTGVRPIATQIYLGRSGLCSFRVDTFFGRLESVPQLHDGALDHEGEILENELVRVFSHLRARLFGKRFCIILLSAILDPFLDRIVEVEDWLDGLPEQIGVEATLGSRILLVCLGRLLGFLEKDSDCF